jgi:hypothetical protein
MEILIAIVFCHNGLHDETLIFLIFQKIVKFMLSFTPINSQRLSDRTQY